MILAGAAAIDRFHPVLLLFAGILLFSSYKLLTESEEEEEDLSEQWAAPAPPCWCHLTLRSSVQAPTRFSS